MTDKLSHLANEDTEQEPETIWAPIPGSSQELALDSRCNITLYHGARGPGKTITQIMRFRRLVGIGYGSFWRGIVIDREFKNLADIVIQSKRFFDRMDDGSRFLAGASEYKWIWPTGEEFLLRHAKRESDYDQFHGHEYASINWNELCKHPTSALFDKMMSTNRSSFTPEKDTPRKKDGTYDTDDGLPLPPIPLEVFATTNPSGPGHNWVKRKFITPAKNGEVVRTEIEIFNPQTQQEEIYIKTQVAIFGSYKENIYLSPQYVAELNSITDENQKEAWLRGSWDVNAGGAFDDLWRSDVHVIQRFRIPSGWRVDRGFDWGSTHPFYVFWAAEANGEEVRMPDGSIFCPVRGSLIICAEWYGTKAIGTNKGLKKSGGDIAIGINKRELEYCGERWMPSRPKPGPADNQISDVKESDVDTIEKKMADKGVRWTKSDKSHGSRKIGFELFRERLTASTRGEGPGIYFMNNCAAAIEILPSLPRDEIKLDDVDTTSEDHIWDAIRYRVLKGNNRLATTIKVTYPT